MPRTEHLADMSTAGLHNERTACLRLIDTRYDRCSESVTEYHANYADRISDELDRRTDRDEQRRTLNHWNATRHGWARFQASSRRAAERIAFAAPVADLDTITTQPEPTGPAPTDRSPMDPRASIHAMFATDGETAAKLDALLNQYRKDVAEFVLEAVEYAAGDDTAEHVKDSSPTLAAWLDGRDAD